MAKPIKKSPPPKGAHAARTRPPRRLSHATAVDGFAFWSGFRGSPWRISRTEALTAPRRRQIIARMLESRQIDLPAGFSNCRSPG